MMAASYKTKKKLKTAIGQSLRYIETSFFGPEYHDNGTFFLSSDRLHMIENGLPKSQCRMARF